MEISVVLLDLNSQTVNCNLQLFQKLKGHCEYKLNFPLKDRMENNGGVSKQGVLVFATLR